VKPYKEDRYLLLFPRPSSNIKVPHEIKIDVFLSFVVWIC